MHALPATTMLGLSSFERHTLVEKRAEHGVKNGSSDLFAPLDRVRPIHEYFRLDLLLTKGSVPRQRMCVCSHAGGTRQRVRNMDDSPPLREAGLHATIFPETIP